jgi:plastocyanin
VSRNILGVFVIGGALAAVFLVVFAALATYVAVSGSGMRDDMGDMMKDMGGMMGDGMGDMMDGMDGMDGMMGGGGPETTGSASGRGAVQIEDFRFQPTTMNVTPGTVVVWTNDDSAPHTATAKAGNFDTGRLNKGESGQVTFDWPGTFEYVCNFHSSMNGRVVVGP